MKEDFLFIRESIEALVKKCETNPLLFFNESDLQSELFTLLISKYSSEVEIQNVFVWGTDKPKSIKRIYTRRLHSELLLPEGRIDLVVLDLNNIRFAVNSKGKFGYIMLSEGNHIFIEIKSSRTNRSRVTSKNQWFRLLFSDIEKLSQYNHPSFLACFDFSGYHDESEITYLQKRKPSKLELIYFISEQADNYSK